MKVQCRPICYGTLFYYKSADYFFVPEVRPTEFAPFNSTEQFFVKKIFQNFVKVVKLLANFFFYFIKSKYLDFIIIKNLHKLQLRFSKI